MKFQRDFLNDKVYEYYVGTYEQGGNEMTYEQLDTYLRVYGMRHFGKTKLCSKVF